MITKENQKAKNNRFKLLQIANQRVCQAQSKVKISNAKNIKATALITGLYAVISASALRHIKHTGIPAHLAVHKVHSFVAMQKEQREEWSNKQKVIIEAYKYTHTHFQKYKTHTLTLTLLHFVIASLRAYVR